MALQWTIHPKKDHKRIKFYSPPILKSIGGYCFGVVRTSVLDSVPHCFSATNDRISMKLCEKIQCCEEMCISCSC